MIIRLGLFLVLLAPGWAMRPMAWESLMRVKAAAEQGNPEAQFLLGLQYKVGDGIDKDRGEAVKWLRKSAESGYAEAQYALGDFYAGLDPTDELADPREAEKWLKSAAAQGNTDAQSRLDVLHAKAAPPDRTMTVELNGRLEPVELTEDPAATMHWSVLLSGLRGADALLVRGLLLENGIYVNREVAAAADSYRGAATQGDARGQLWIGLMYAEGRGVTKDPVAAGAWLSLAAGNGSSAAPAALAKVKAALTLEQSDAVAQRAKEPIGQPAKNDPAETAKWSLLLSGLRGADAFLVRGFVLENGIHVTRDLSAAADNYRLASARGDARGQLWLGLMKAEDRAETNVPPVAVVKAAAAAPVRETSGAVKKP